MEDTRLLTASQSNGWFRLGRGVIPAFLDSNDDRGLQLNRILIRRATMYIEHLDLKDFRNYRQLQFDIPVGISVFHGANAQGKTNLLESICFLATTRLSRSVPDRELISWEALNEEMPFARLAVEVVRRDRRVQLEILLTPRIQTPYVGDLSEVTVQKTVRVNGLARRAVDFLGELNMVMFTPRDVDLISGEPALRRRHLDMMISQVNPRYLRALQRYNKVLARRNQLLRQVSMRRLGQGEMAFWDEELVTSGAYVWCERRRSLADLEELVRPVHEHISGEEHLTLEYRPNTGSDEPWMSREDDVAGRFRDALAASRQDETARGMTLIGPHRDELRFRIGGVDMGSFGSRGQQRTIALSLKLAESRFMLAETGETPVLLLDDVLSELDRDRRAHVTENIGEYQQVLMTTTDPDRFPAGFLDGVSRYSVQGGTITPS